MLLLKRKCSCGWVVSALSRNALYAAMKDHEEHYGVWEVTHLAANAKDI